MDFSIAQKNACRNIAGLLLGIWLMCSAEIWADIPPRISTRFTYDANGNLKTRTDANGAVTTYEYDALNRLIAIHYPDRTSVTFRYNASGLLEKMTDALGASLYEYDIHGRLTRATDPNDRTVQYQYDPRGLITQLRYPDGNTAQYTWDADGRLNSVEAANGVTRYEYDPIGKLIGRTLPNGIQTRYEYDAANQSAATSRLERQFVARI